MDPRVKEALESDCGHGVCALLEKTEPNDVDELLEVVSHRSSYTEREFLNATYILGRLGDERAVPVITANLPKLDEKGQICAIDALGRIGTGVDAEVIAKYGDSDNPDVRKYTLKALSRVGGKTAKEKLEALNAKEKIPWLKKVGEDSIRKIAPIH